jgi:hypothetical protein
MVQFVVWQFFSVLFMFSEKSVPNPGYPLSRPVCFFCISCSRPKNTGTIRHVFPTRPVPNLYSLTRPVYSPTNNRARQLISVYILVYENVE